jgi:hypothetical protein
MEIGGLRKTDKSRSTPLRGDDHLERPSRVPRNPVRHGRAWPPAYAGATND